MFKHHPQGLMNKKMSRSVVGFLLILSLSISTFIVTAATINISGSGTVSTSQTIPLRINRNSVTSDCSGKAYPGTWATSSPPHGYTVEGTFGPVTEDSCITVTWNNVTCTGNSNIHPVAFRNGFDPNWGGANATNYLGDPGASDITSFSFPVSAGDRFVLVFHNNFGTQSCDYTYSFSYEGMAPVVQVSEDGMPLPAFYDGRINDYDTASPVAVYPHQVDGETGLIIYNPDGVEMLVVSPQQIADAPDNPDSNILIASANEVSLYRIAGENGGLWQINAPQYNGKTYVMIFPELFHSGGYESFELEP